MHFYPCSGMHEVSNSVKQLSGMSSCCPLMWQGRWGKDGKCACKSWTEEHIVPTGSMTGPPMAVQHLSIRLLGAKWSYILNNTFFFFFFFNTGRNYLQLYIYTLHWHAWRTKGKFQNHNPYIRTLPQQGPVLNDWDAWNPQGNASIHSTGL